MSKPTDKENPASVPTSVKDTPEKPAPAPEKVKEIGGTKGPEPTRYGDWEHNGRVTDF